MARQHQLTSRFFVLAVMVAFCALLIPAGMAWAAPDEEGADAASEEVEASDESSSYDEDEEDVTDDEEGDDEESDLYIPEGDGATGRIAGEVDSRLPELAAERWKGNSPILGAGRRIGAALAHIAVGENAMPGRNEQTSVDFVSKVPEMIQWDSLIGGCEIVSMTSVLQSMGFDVTPQTMADDYVMYDTAGQGDYLNYYIGSPYSSGGGFPPALAYAGNKFLDDRGSDWRFRNVTGTSFSTLLSQVDYGLPVLIWTTMNMDDPLWTGFDQGEFEWYNNEHCVVLYGHNDDEGTVAVMDPMAGFVDRDAAEFERIYDECGKMALALSFG